MFENIVNRRIFMDLFCPLFSGMKMFIFGLAFILYILHIFGLSVSNVFFE